MIRKWLDYKGITVQQLVYAGLGIIPLFAITALLIYGFIGSLLL